MRRSRLNEQKLSELVRTRPYTGKHATSAKKQGKPAKQEQLAQKYSDTGIVDYPQQPQYSAK